MCFTAHTQEAAEYRKIGKYHLNPPQKCHKKLR